MTFTRTRLLTVTPLILAAISTGAAAQEATSVTSLLIENTQTVNADVVSGSDVVFPLEISIPADGTYVFSVPAGSGIQLLVNGQSLFGETTTGTDEALKAVVSMTAGTYIIEVSGEDLTLADLADVTANILGMPVASIVSIASPVEASEDVASSSSSSNVAAASAQLASAVSLTSPTETTNSFVPTVLSGSDSTSSSNESGSSVDGAMLRDALRGAVTSAFGGRGSSSSNPVVPIVPIVIGEGEAQSSPLSPPSGVTLTQAVEIVGGPTDDDVVSSTGQTMFGAVMDPMTYDTVIVTIEPSGREVTVDVGPTTGQFAFRLFIEDLLTGAVSVSLVGASSADDTVVTDPVSYDYTTGLAVDGLTEALSRLTYGPTVDLYSRVRTMGLEAYVNEQLDPDSIPDANFGTYNVEAYFDDLGSNFTTVKYAEMAHRISYAAFSDKQLQEVMGEFWSNHFFATTKGTNFRVQNIIDRQFFRDNAFGNFEDLLLYSARSPLMSQFLDNDQSRAGSLNENYAREILELHTVGVDGGYSDEDIIEVARIFTGWDYQQVDGTDTSQPEYEFFFDTSRHDDDDKYVEFIDASFTGRSGDAGVEEGEELITLLANDPRTHEYVCGKIVQRFVADVPPANFVDICTAAWAANDGDTGEVLRAVLLAPEFLSGAAARGTKAKTPYEYSVSILRAFGIEVDSSEGTTPLLWFWSAAENAGYSQLEFDLPTGLDEVATTWVNSASLLGAYRVITERVVNRPENYDLDLGAMVEEAGLETAEEAAAFLLTIATADVFTNEEYEALIGVLKGEDGIFEPSLTDESSAYERAAGLIIVLPSFSLQ